MALSMSKVRVPGNAMLRAVRSASATILPASRIRASSRGDFNSGLGLTYGLSTKNPHDRLPHRLHSLRKHLQYTLMNILNRARAANFMNQSLVTIVANHVRHRCVEHFQSFA